MITLTRGALSALLLAGASLPALAQPTFESLQRRTLRPDGADRIQVRYRNGTTRARITVTRRLPSGVDRRSRTLDLDNHQVRELEQGLARARLDALPVISAGVGSTSTVYVIRSGSSLIVRSFRGALPQQTTDLNRALDQLVAQVAGTNLDGAAARHNGNGKIGLGLTTVEHPTRGPGAQILRDHVPIGDVRIDGHRASGSAVVVTGVRAKTRRPVDLQLGSTPGARTSRLPAGHEVILTGSPSNFSHGHHLQARTTVAMGAPTTLSGALPLAALEFPGGPAIIPAAAPSPGLPLPPSPILPTDPIFSAPGTLRQIAGLGLVFDLAPSVGQRRLRIRTRDRRIAGHLAALTGYEATLMGRITPNVPFDTLTVSTLVSPRPFQQRQVEAMGGDRVRTATGVVATLGPGALVLRSNVPVGNVTLDGYRYADPRWLVTGVHATTSRVVRLSPTGGPATGNHVLSFGTPVVLTGSGPRLVTADARVTRPGLPTLTGILPISALSFPGGPGIEPFQALGATGNLSPVSPD